MTEYSNTFLAVSCHSLTRPIRCLSWLDVLQTGYTKLRGKAESRYKSMLLCEKEGENMSKSFKFAPLDGVIEDIPKLVILKYDFDVVLKNSLSL